MIRANSPHPTLAKWISVLCGSLFLSLTLIAQAGGPPPQRGKPVISEPEQETDKSSEEAEDTEDEQIEEEEERSTPPTTQPFTDTNTEQPTDSQEEEQPEASEPPPRFPEPSAIVSLENNRVNLRLINASDTVISYQVIEGTGERVLGERSETELQNLPVPLNLTYRRQDGGLLLVTPKAVAPGVLEVRFEPTGQIFFDTKSLNITGTGSVFLN